MNYTEKIVTQDQLKGDVLCYWQMNGEIESASGVNSRYLPKAQSLLVFNFGNDIDQLNAPKANIKNQSFFIVPAFASSIIINQKGKIDLFGISFVGEGLFKLVQQPATKFLSHFPDKLNKRYKELHLELNEKSFLEKTEITERFLTENLNQKLNNPPLQNALKIITEANGNANISDIAKNIYVSERQLQRLFKTRIGISPKNYCKIIRVNNYLDFILNKGSSVDWMELVVKYNYHDQPHLINEVKSIANLSPRKIQTYRDTLYHRYIGG